MIYTFNIVDGPIGSHKTTSLLNDFRSNPIPATIGTMTNALSDQYRSADGLDIEMISRVIRSEDDYTAASKIYRQRLKDDASKIYAVNQSVAIDCQELDPDREYFFDEIPTVFETFKFNSLPYTQDFVSGWLGHAHADHPAYYELVATDFIRNIAVSGWKDDLIKGSEEILTVAQRIASDHYRVFVLAKAFNKFKNCLPGQLQFFVQARPSLFPKHSTFIGANYKKSLQYMMWDASEDVEFVPHPRIKAKHADLRHKAKQTSIYYVSEKNFSKKLFEDKTPDGKKPTSFPKIAKPLGTFIAQRFPDEEFIWCANTIYEKTKWAGEKGTMVSSNCRGWNGARHLNMAVYLAAINFDPATLTFLRKVYGISKTDAKYALTFETAYQFAGRTSLRMKGSDAPIILIFGDRATAKAMQSFIPGCKEPEFIDLGIPELRFEEPEEDGDEEAALVKIAKPLEEVREDNNERNNLRNRRKRILQNHEATPQYDGFQFRFWAHYSALTTWETEALEWETVVDLFKHNAHETTVPEKLANKMYREGTFFDTDNHLLAGNILSTKMVVLDLDIVRGDLNELSVYLRSRKMSHLIVNTYSCLNVNDYAERALKVRVLIPLSEAVDAENYRRIIRLLNRDIREKFPCGDFGSQFPVDPQCMTINNRFLAPCRPERGTPVFIDGTFCDYDLTRFVKKAPVFLDARWCMVRNLPEDIAPLAIKRHIGGSVKKAADDIVLECAAEAGAGNGDGPFYKAAVELVKVGYSKEEAIAALTGKERLFGSGEGRNAQRAVTDALMKKRAA